MKKIFLLLFVCFFLLGELFSQSTQGHEFYFSFNRARPDREKNMILTISSEKDGIATFTDALGATVNRAFTSGTTTIDLAYADGNDANEVVHLAGMTSCYQIASNVVDNRGYIVETFESDSITPLNVSIYAALSGYWTTDAANVYPYEALGNEYYVISHLGFLQTGDTLASEALIVATENNTEIEIIPTCLLDYQAASEDLKNITITLNKGQTYQIRAKGLLDLTGTLIRTKDDGNLTGNKCKRIAVFSGHQHGYPGDYEYEQLFPKHLLGKEYLINAPEDTGDNWVRVVATEACTDVTINGVLVATLNQTDYYEYLLPLSTGCYIQTSKPTGVAMFTSDFINKVKNNNDASMIVLAPIEQNLDSIMFTGITNASTPTNKVSIVAPTEFIDSVYFYQLIGSTFTPIVLSGWSTISANTDYSTVTSNISPTSTYKIVSKKGGFNAYVYGYNAQNPEAEYGYSVGSSARLTSTSFFLNNDPSLNSNNLNGICVNDDVAFHADLQYSFHKIEWDFGDGVKDTIYSPENKTTHKYTSSGVYPVTMIVYKIISDCFGTGELVDTAKAAISIKDQVSSNIATTLCKGSSLGSTRTDDAIFGGQTPEYEWSNGAITESIVLSDDHGTSAKYWVKTYDSNCHSFIDTISVNIRPIFESLRAENHCNNQSNISPSETIGFTSATPNTLAGVPIAYTWYKAGSPTGETTQTIPVTDNFGTTTKYYVKAESGCLYVDTINVTVPAQVTNTLTASHNKVCGDGNTTVTIDGSANGPATIAWEMSENGAAFMPVPNAGTFTYSYSATQTTAFRLISTGVCETITKNVTVTANPPFTASLDAFSSNFFPSSQTLPVSGGNVEFTVTTDIGGSYLYTWTPNVSSSNTYSKFIDENTAELTYSVIVSDIDNLCNTTTNTLEITLDEIIINTIISHSSSKNKSIAEDLLDKLQEGYRTIVYNRYGQLISEKANGGWDGIYKGKPADAGVYFYVIEYKSGGTTKEIKGTVEVIK